MHVRAVLPALGISLTLALASSAAWSQGYAGGQNPAQRQAGGAGPQQIGPQQVRPQPAHPQQARAGQQPVPAAQQRLPCPFPELTQREAAYRDHVLKYWEERSAKVKRFECDITKWEYGNEFGPADPNVAYRISYGEIKYERPDKGMFRIDTVTQLVPPNNAQEANQKPRYAPLEGEIGEHWVSNGKSIFVFDERQQQLIEYQLPDDMQGQGIVNGPLPFLFGAKAEAIKSRYWTKMILPPPVEDQYWLEAYPKHRADRSQYLKVLVILDKDEYLPIALQIFDRNYTRSNGKRISINFSNRIENPNLILEKLNLFHRAFFEPALPAGWKKVVEKIPAQGARMAQGQPEGQGR